MYFYKYYPFAKTFLSELGVDIVISPETNKEILNIGSKYCIDDACLPVKVCHGHVYNLKDKVDYLLIPRLTSVSKKEYICPKFGGLPEMIKYSIPDLPSVIDIEINMYKRKSSLYKSLFALGFIFTKNFTKVKKAMESAFKVQSMYEIALLKGNLPTAFIDKNQMKNKNKGTIVGIVSHPYLLYDSFINMHLLDKLTNKNFRFITPEEIDHGEIDRICNNLEKRMFWSSGKSIIGSALYMMSIDKIKGLLILTSFACGIDSLSVELIYRIANKSYKKPIMILTLDEHTGEANFNTRLEAFSDLIERRQKIENNLSTYGGSIYSC